MPCIKKIWDVHGAVPEETEFQGDSAQAKLFGEYETLAAANADVILAVSNAMGRHLCKKYGDHLQQKIVILPIISKYEQLPIAADRQEGALPRIIYVGGVDKWQQIPLMLQIINAAYTLASWHIYTQEPETFMALLPDELRVKDLPIKSVTRDDLLQIYPKFSFGFVLRDRNILNVVSCPTKLVEYIALGIIPIMDEVSIGDFVELGLCYITKDDVLKRDLPSLEKTLEMREINYEVYKAIYNSYLQGLRRLCIAASL
ncbi:hypothetical protein FACS1894158_13950 [Betaproteobacteria bacterium]|nr:hypothetical protein FACS1894158_13950 [Betaproteobacteria bacterium]